MRYKYKNPQREFQPSVAGVRADRDNNFVSIEEHPEHLLVSKNRGKGKKFSLFYKRYGENGIRYIYRLLADKCAPYGKYIFRFDAQIGKIFLTNIENNKTFVVPYAIAVWRLHPVSTSNDGIDPLPLKFVLDKTEG